MLDPDQGLDLTLGQQVVHGPLHLAAFAKTSPGAQQPLAQFRQGRQRPLHVARPRGLIQFGLPRAAIPQQPIALRN